MGNDLTGSKSRIGNRRAALQLSGSAFLADFLKVLNEEVAIFGSHMQINESGGSSDAVDTPRPWAFFSPIFVNLCSSHSAGSQYENDYLCFLPFLSFRAPGCLNLITISSRKYRTTPIAAKKINSDIVVLFRKLGVPILDT